MEGLLVDELSTLGAQDIKETRAGASFSGELDVAYRVCLWSRIANSVLLLLCRFDAESPESLYEGIGQIDWGDHFDVDDSFAIDFITTQSNIKHSHFGALKVKDAIVDQFRTRVGTRPSVQTLRPDIRINVHLHRNQASVSIDLSGESLHKRGYRKKAEAAPLKENLAAAILIRCGWPDIAKLGGSFLDPMCGSGTLAIEAALIAANQAPGELRSYWGFSNWKQHNIELWNSLLLDAQRRSNAGKKTMPAIRAYDRDLNAVHTTSNNIDKAGFHGLIHVERRELAKCAPASSDKPGLVVTNPPYGERLGEQRELPELYLRFGYILKSHFLHWQAGIITNQPELGKQTGLRATKIYRLYNGAIECRLLRFEIEPKWFYGSQAKLEALDPSVRSAGAQMFANRLQKNIKHLKSWINREHISCYRIYDADLPEYSLAIDIYEGEKLWAHVQEYQAPKNIDPKKAKQRLREALGVILYELSISEQQLFLKVRLQQKAGNQYEQLSNKRNFIEVSENNLRFLVNFEDYLDTGLFLDHRITRQMISTLAYEKRFLNLFAYTGTATVYAAKGGAITTTTVDMSNTYLAWAQRNMKLNGFESKAHQFIQANCLDWLEIQDNQQRYDLIFLDPPSFSNSKRMSNTFDIQRDHLELLDKVINLLNPGGILIFSTNLRRFKLRFQSTETIQVSDISKKTLPVDFRRNPRIHSCWKIEKLK